MNDLFALLFPCRVFKVESFDLVSAMKSGRWKAPVTQAPAPRPRLSLVRFLEVV